MKQDAIYVTLDNVSAIAATLLDYTAQDILDEATHHLNRGSKVVLVRDVRDGMFTVSHIVTESMFFANASATLNTAFFEDVTQL